MKLFNLKDEKEIVNFNQAVKQGLGKNQGLFFPSELNVLDNVEELLDLSLIERSQVILKHLIGQDLNKEQIDSIVSTAFSFEAPLMNVSDNIHCLELFHGPTLAFKDFGGRFMAQCLSTIAHGKTTTILTATSGDTGAAVAHAFHQIPGINVVILYPKGKISVLQEKLFTTLGDNIHTVAIDGDFDDCQQLVKQSFDDDQFKSTLHLNSANSINISRLLAQVCYYFEAIAQIPKEDREKVVFSVPSGNFGNLTAGLVAKTIGLPVKRFIAATNLNDTVPRYLKTGDWLPNSTQATMSNAMDVSRPNNWPRVEALIDRGYLPKDILSGDMIDEDYTQVAMRQLAQAGYVSEPHAAIAYKALKRQLKDDEVGIFLGTAHPAKFRDTVENVLGQPISLPQTLAECAGRESFSIDLDNDFLHLKEHMLSLLTSES